MTLSRKWMMACLVSLLFVLVLAACEGGQDGAGDSTEENAQETSQAGVQETSQNGGEGSQQGNANNNVKVVSAESLSQFQEAPMLRELVESGDLPAVEERLAGQGRHHGRAGA